MAFKAMKKFIIFLISIICLSSCAVSKVEDKRVLPESGRLIAIEKFEMDDHYYIVYTIQQEHIGYSKWSTSVVHDPNCPCKKSK